MTIDERIEALTQSLELLSSLHRDLEETSAKGFAELRAELRENMGKLTKTMEQLGAIVIAHEERIERLEDGQQ
jgi:hypothetical protein